MHLLLLGAGGREHALAWKLRQSKKLSKLFIAPGNAGTKSLGENVDIDILDFEAIKACVIANSIELVVVGSEDPLVHGIYDFFISDDEIKHVKVIGPSKAGAQLEGSKAFAKRFMERHNIPTARYLNVGPDTLDQGCAFLESLQAPYVLKADGLAAGKGVLILDNIEEAKQELKNMLAGKFGAASRRVLIEEFLDGLELSVFVLTDGETYKILPEAKDYKRIGEGDLGLNTGGMGAVSPVPFVDDAFLSKVEERVIKPTVRGLKEENIPYKGFLFLGLIMCNNEPFVIEYNVRMGDPETEVVMLRLQADLLDLFEGLAHGNLADKTMAIDARCASTVFMVSGGYPEAYETNKPITFGNLPSDTFLFHAGTKCDGEQIVSAGGRVLAASALGKTLEEALALSYEAVEQVNFDKKYVRKDIGKDMQAFVK